MQKIRLDGKLAIDICEKLDMIAADLRKISAEKKRKVEITTHVQRDEILITVNPEECRGRLEKHFYQLQRITTMLWKQVFIHAETNREGKTGSTINAAGYRKDHFFDGHEKLTYGQYELTPEQVVFGDYPIGLATEIMMKEMKRELQRKKKK